VTREAVSETSASGDWPGRGAPSTGSGSLSDEPPFVRAAAQPAHAADRLDERQAPPGGTIHERASESQCP
jgi:hypothetical protein